MYKKAIEYIKNLAYQKKDKVIFQLAYRFLIRVSITESYKVPFGISLVLDGKPYILYNPRIVTAGMEGTGVKAGAMLSVSCIPSTLCIP